MKKCSVSLVDCSIRARRWGRKGAFAPESPGHCHGALPRDARHAGPGPWCGGRGWGEVPPWAYLAVVLAVVVSGLLLSARGVFRRQPASAYLRPASYRPLAAMCCLGAGAVHLLVAPEHFQEWWGYGCFFLALATFQTLYSLGLAAPAGLLPRREAYLLVGITANLLVLGLYAVSRTRGIRSSGPTPVSWSP